MQARLDGATERLKREHDERAWLAWHTAALPRTKKFPPLKDLLIGAKPKRPKTWQEQLAAVMAFDKRINAATSSHR